MRKWYLLLVLCIGMNICYGQRNFSEVIEVDSANINVTNMKLFETELLIYSIYPGVLDDVSNTELVAFDINSKLKRFFNYKHIAVSTNSPLWVDSSIFYYGKNRSLEKPNHLVKLDSTWTIIDSISIATKGDFNFPTKPYTLLDNMYLPCYIEDGEQEYFSITKVTSDLKVLWTKYYNEDFAYSSAPSEILSSPDSNLYVSSNVYVEDERRYYNQLLKLDTSGNVTWEYFNTEELEHGAVAPWFTTLSDSNIVVSYRVDRFTNDTFRTRGLHFTPYRLIWLDHEGNLIKKKYYVSQRLKRFFVNKVETGLGDYFYLMGVWDDGEALENKNLLLKLNNEGDSLWHRTYYHPDYSLDSVGFSIRDIHEFPDGRIAVLSMISTPYDWNKIWLFMVDSEGNCLTDNCISEGDVISMNTYEIKYEKLSLYPNPTRERIYWNERHALQDVSIYDLFGRRMIDRTSDAIHSVDVGGLPAGTYILEGTDREGRMHRGKFIVQ